MSAAQPILLSVSVSAFLYRVHESAVFYLLFAIDGFVFSKFLATHSLVFGQLAKTFLVTFRR